MKWVPDRASHIAEHAKLLRQESLERLFASTLKEDRDHEAWEAAVTTLHHEINELRNDVALATQALLVVAGKMPSEKAREWIGRNLKPR